MVVVIVVVVVAVVVVVVAAAAVVVVGVDLGIGIVVAGVGSNYMRRAMRCKLRLKAFSARMHKTAVCLTPGACVHGTFIPGHAGARHSSSVEL